MAQRRALLALFLIATGLGAQTGSGPTVRFKTNLGDIDVLLLSDVAPRTVQNFLNYVNRGAYNGSFFHRAVKDFVIQGGGYKWDAPSGNYSTIPQDPAVRNEFSVSNTRGTIAMAKLDGLVNSATNQWFFNLGNNASNLDNQNGGFTVFGRIINDAGLAVMDKIAAVPTANLGSPFDQIPLQNYTTGAIKEENLVMVTSITVLDAKPEISSGGVISSSGFGGYAYTTSGGLIEIYGTALSDTTRSWAAADFTDGAAPTSLDGVSLTIGNRPAFISFVSPTQVNAQVPAGIPSGITVPLVLTRRALVSNTLQVAFRSNAAGLLAPGNFKVDDRQFVVAVRPAGAVIINNGRVPGLSAAPAVPGETLIFYGAGFGSAGPAGTPVAGRINQGELRLNTPVQFKVDGIPATILYAGFAPGFVGVYQFNVTLPPALPAGELPLEVTLGTEVLAQKLFLPVAAGN
jgi:uncharacterized protein (TIGR03437 family)